MMKRLRQERQQNTCIALFLFLPLLDLCFGCEITFYSIPGRKYLLSLADNTFSSVEFSHCRYICATDEDCYAFVYYNNTKFCAVTDNRVLFAFNCDACLSARKKVMTGCETSAVQTTKTAKTTLVTAATETATTTPSSPQTSIIAITTTKMTATAAATTEAAATTAATVTAATTEATAAATVTAATTTTAITTTAATTVKTPFAGKLCTCTCIETNTTMLKSIQERRTLLHLSKNELSSAKRKLTSADDQRLSSKRIGYVGIFALSFTIGGIVFFDYLKFICYLKRNC